MGAQVFQHENPAEHLDKFARLVRIAGGQQEVVHLNRFEQDSANG
jgi:hypothetical protein